MKNRSEFGWLELILGILLLLLGGYTFFRPGSAVEGFVIAYGIGMIVIGAADIAFYVQLDRLNGFGPVGSLVSSVLNILAGLMLLMNPRIGILVIATLLPVGLIIHCIARLCNLDFVRLFGGTTQYRIALVLNVFGIVAGLVLLLQPFSTVRLVARFGGVYLILLGLRSVIAALSRLGEQH